MKFSTLLNNHAEIVIILLALTLFLGLRAGFKNGGWNRHLVYMWSLIIYTQYILFTPTYYYFEGRTSIIGTDISGYYGSGFFFNFLAILGFVVGYWIKGKNSNVVFLSDQEAKVKNPRKIIAVMFYTLYSVVLINMAIGGINLTDVFLGSKEVGLGAKGESYFFQNFTDSLITVIILGYLFKIPGRTLLLWILLSFFLFTLLGFRYRIMLTLFGLFFVFLYRNKIGYKQVLYGVLGVVCFFYIIMFITENRSTLLSREYNYITYNPVDFDYENYFDQTRGSLADMTIYKVFDNPNKNPNYDYGISIVGYIFIRMIPRSIYPDKDRFYPPPQYDAMVMANEAWWAKFTGEAILSISAFYIAFGWLGVLLGHFLSAFLIRHFGDKVIKKDNLSITIYIIVALASFQWITRGYFPQAVDHAIYLLIPVWVLKLSIKFGPKTTDSRVNLSPNA